MYINTLFLKNRIISRITFKLLVSANGVENTVVYYCFRFLFVLTFRIYWNVWYTLTGLCNNETCQFFTTR